QIMDGTSPWWNRGSFAVDGSGNLTGWNLPNGNYIAGYDFPTELKPCAPSPEHPAYKHGQRIAIPRLYLHTISTGAYTISGQDNPAFRTGESTSVAPTLRSEAKFWRIPGRGSAQTPDITQSIPSPLQVGAITMEV